MRTDPNADREPYEHSAGRLIDDYPDFTICGGVIGYTAQMRSPDGRGHVGRLLAAVDLDGLAAKMDNARALVIPAGHAGQHSPDSPAA